MERSLVLIKPDAIQRGLAGKIISRLEEKGLKIVAMKMLRMDKNLAQRHYAVHKGKAFFDDLVNFIASSPIIAAVFQGGNAVEIIRQVMGETDPAKARSGTIRGDFGIDIGHNLVHGSDSLENASKEIELFFKTEEILNYDRELDKWLY
ncbi:MAG: nucleoside-diphosphate kinase [Dehalococcoidia bacterium]|jgi:nucleoside-diphosphate kinase|nr:nucleoside-diphosphate kinase [Dehalococcoidia bacterium]MCK5182512.1 nucleoside-diphosphate kinase [Dehalococcoidia bacterium]